MTRPDVTQIWIEAPASERERLVAELYACGTLGLEERDDGLVAYFPSLEPQDPVLEAIAALADADLAVRVGAPTRVAPTDWEVEWRRGLAPRLVAGLWIRPSWCASQGQPELCIDPQQAFGSGEHATTRIALELLLAVLRPEDRVLDVGTGSGVLALGALRQGAHAAVAFDLDFAACHNARDNARSNGLPLPLFCGTLAALSPGRRFDLVAANLLWAELEPWVPRVADHARREVIVAGPLARERDRVCARFESQGLALGDERTESQSGDDWWGARFHRATPPGRR